MGLMKSLVGLGGADRTAARLIEVIQQRGMDGEREFWVGYTQQDVGGRTSATMLAPYIRGKIEKAGHRIIDGEGGKYGDDVRFLIRVGTADR